MTRFYFDKFIYSDKRKSMTKNMIVSILAIICALFFALIIAMIVYRNPSLFWKIIRDIFAAPFNATSYSATISSISIFVIGGLSFLFAFRSGLFNIGISGQMLFGAILAVVFAKYMHGVPNGLGQILILLISIVGATAIASLIGVLKAFLNLNEVVSSIMLNWIIYFAATYLLIASKVPLASDGSNTQALPANLVLQWHGQSWLPLLIIAITCLAFVIILLGSTTLGKKIIHTGMSTSAAKYAGYNVKSNQILAIGISGILAGIMGPMVYCGLGNSMPVTSLAKSIPVEGFNGISVGLIAMSNPWAVAPVSVFFGMIDSSKATIASLEGVDGTITDLLFGIVVYGAAIVSIFYYIVPIKWYLRIFKGKQYLSKHQQFLNNINNQIEDVSNIIWFLRKSTKNIQNFDYEKAILKKYGIKISSLLDKKQYKEYVNKVYKLYALFKKHIYYNFMSSVYEGIDKNKAKKFYLLNRTIKAEIKQMGGIT